MKLLKRIIFFLTLNFSGLALGSWLMNNGPQSFWYANLNRAPWTPPGWVFGVAWTIIMICFSVYLAFLFNNSKSQKAIIAYLVQLVLNTIWNYLFFNQHFVGLGLICIVALTIIVFYFFFNFKNKRYLLIPYCIWLLIATSLNAYILIYN